MASVLAAYYILISTCKMLKDLVLEYLKKIRRWFKEEDYENLFPMSIGLNTNQY
jgi:hypothetical protein